jgi:hypothetical protein
MRSDILVSSTSTIYSRAGSTIDLSECGIDDFGTHYSYIFSNDIMRSLVYFTWPVMTYFLLLEQVHSMTGIAGTLLSLR